MLFFWKNYKILKRIGNPWIVAVISVSIFRNNNLKEIKATRNPIGLYPKELKFENNEIRLQKHDKMYMFSDGYADQIGGKEEKKFKKNKFRDLLTTIQTNSLNEQKIILNETIVKWQDNKFEQTDDILIIGIEV